MKNFIKINRALAAEKKVFLILCATVLCAGNMFAQAAATDSKTVDCNGDVTITATPKANYHFVKWVNDTTNDEYFTASLTVSNIKAVKSYTAHFALNEAIDPSIVDPDNPTPALDDVINLTPHTDDDCLEFEHWSDIDDPTDPNYAIVPRPFTYKGVAPAFTAVFKTKTYNVTVNTATGDDTEGTVTISLVP